MKSADLLSDNSNYSAFFGHINYTFKNTELLKEALTHPSLKLSIQCAGQKELSIEQKIMQKSAGLDKSRSRPFNYERLEFLGDRVLGFVIGSALYLKFSDESEGKISRRYANLVCKDICIKIAKNLNLDKYVQISHGEEKQNGRNNPSTLENALEALIGAIYLDSGIEAAKNFIEQHWAHYIHHEDSSQSDAKSLLQEHSQMLYGTIPEYGVVEVQGSDHAPIFVVFAEVAGVRVQAEGASKKVAEKEAARLLLNKLQVSGSKISSQ